MSEHAMEYVDNFLDREIRAGCSCGWESVPVASRFGAADEWKAHVAVHSNATQYAEVQRLREDIIPMLRAEAQAAEARGYARAVANLRDDDAYHAHQHKTGVYDGGRHFIADYLEAVSG